MYIRIKQMIALEKIKISILEQLGICISKEKEAEIYNKFSEEEIDSYAKMLIKENL